KCPNCGHQIEQDDVFCGECGTKVNRQSNAVTSAEDDIKQADSHSNKQQATQSTHNSTMNSTSNASHEQSQSMNQSNASAETHANHNQYQHSQPNN
ncbi:zinc ribbon domain-containing protein, partial [Staphylococcus haemolyticus]